MVNNRRLQLDLHPLRRSYAASLPNVKLSLITIPLKKSLPTKGRVKIAIINERTLWPCLFLTPHRCKVKCVEKIINFTKNSDVSLCFRINIIIFHLSPFYLILLCFSLTHYISNDWALQPIYLLFQYVIIYFVLFWVNPES